MEKRGDSARGIWRGRDPVESDRSQRFGKYNLPLGLSAQYDRRKARFLRWRNEIAAAKDCLDLLDSVLKKRL